MDQAPSFKALPAFWNRPFSTVKSAGHQIYERQYALFRRLYEQTKDIAQELSG
jgi:xylulokinase